ncbi:flagellar motor switch protein FliM [Lentisalinibacter sediminis]|uniref:flagellar motor switch protein FliM n=1 Tax=Lentisalinibacter sediminis TaxID=2992237 RepID=UPI00386BCC75
MSEKVLSQDEMDALMDGVSSGKVEVQTDTGPLDAEVYDYEIPARNQIRRGSLPRLDHLNRQLARRMERTLMRQLRVETRVVTRTIETLRFETVCDGFPTPPLLMLLGMKPLTGPALMFLDPPLINALVDRYFGGANGNECRSDREGYTPGEVRISEIVMSRFLENMKEVWRPVLELEPEIVQTESDLQQLQVAAPNDPVVKCEFGVEPGESSGRIQLILPLETILPVFDSLDGAERSGGNDQDEVWSGMLREHVLASVVELTTGIGDKELSLGNVARLAPGDIIPINSPKTVTLSVGDTPVLQGEFGLSRGRNAVRTGVWVAARKD